MSSKCFFLVCFFYINFISFFVSVNSVAQLLASGTVGDGETNGYNFLVNVVIALLEKRRQHSGLEI